MTIHLEDFLSKFDKVKQTGSNQWIALCPAHDDRHRSLSISAGKNKINFHCHAGCTGDEILQTIGLSWEDIYFNDEYGYQSQRDRKIVAEYDYTDERGNLLYQVVKYSPKTFRQRRKDNDGDWIWGLGDTRRVLYRLSQVITAIINSEKIFIVEGEKDADRLIQLGLMGTTNPMGAGKWDDSYTDTLTGAEVIIIPDNDKAGFNHASNVATKLLNKAKSVKVVELPGLDKKEDISDWLNQGGSKEKLIKLVEEAPLFDCKNELTTQFSEPIHDFYPSRIAIEVINSEETKGCYWMYIPGQDVFYFYDDQGYWRIKDQLYLKKNIRDHLRLINPKWDKRNPINEVYSAIKHLLLESKSQNTFNAEYTPDLKHINVLNGMLDWRTGELLAHEPNYNSIYQIPVLYDHNKQCPKWEEALEQWIPEQEARDFIQEYIGYCLIQDTSRQKAVILTGSGSNGKSTFLKIIASLFGSNNLSSIPLHRIPNRFETANLQNKLVNICSDIDPTFLDETGIIKSLISGDSLRGEYKYGNSFDFIPVVRLIFSANEIPKTKDKSDAWYRRFEIIEFPNSFRNTDPDFDPCLEAKLLDELPGILNWALKGLRRLIEQGSFTESEWLERSKKIYQLDNDSIIAFIEEKTIYGVEDIIICSELYKEYQFYCEEAGLKATSRNKFTTKLKDMGFTVIQKWIKGSNNRCYFGLKLKQKN